MPASPPMSPKSGVVRRHVFYCANDVRERLQVAVRRDITTCRYAIAKRLMEHMFRLGFHQQRRTHLSSLTLRRIWFDNSGGLENLDARLSFV